MAHGTNAASPSEWSEHAVMDEDSPELQLLRDDESLLCEPGKSYFSYANITPSDSQNGAKSYLEVAGGLSASTVFFSGANSDVHRTDLIILSSDYVTFYVHSARLYAVSNNGFNFYLPLSPIIAMSDKEAIVEVPERSGVINLLLHAAYSMPCAHCSPSFADLSETTDTLGVYGLPVPTFLSPGTPISDALLFHAPTRPLDLYTLAARHDLHDLAVTTSPHLLTLSLPSVTDEIARNIGPVYLKKLFFLHLGRTDALKHLLQSPPSPHAPTPSCGFGEQGDVTRAWALGCAYLSWNLRPYTSAGTIQTALCQLAGRITCPMCKTSLLSRIRDLVIEWSEVKVRWHCHFLKHVWDIGTYTTMSLHSAQ